jgi:hypothetical protein
VTQRDWESLAKLSPLFAILTDEMDGMSFSHPGNKTLML